LDFFTGLGIHAPDDMSGIILNAYVHHLRHKPYDLAADVEEYKRFWREQESQDKEESARVERVRKSIHTY
jgi:hypothetical protein